MKNRLIKIASLLALLALAPGGCAKKDAPKPDESVFRYPLPAKVKSLDSGNVEDVYGMLVLSNICESLYTYHYFKRPYVVEPMLADGMPEISEDKLTYIIRIKKGILFQDDPCFPEGKGRELKADDFVFAFKRMANIRFISQNWGGFKDRIVGLDDFREYTRQFKTEFDVDYSQEVEGLKAIDDYTLQIKLVKPWPQVLDDLTSAITAPVPKEAVDLYRQEMIYHPIGTGPYYLSEWHKGVYLELIKNPNYRRDFYPSDGMPEDKERGLLESAGKPMPFIDRIIFRIIEEEQPTWFLFMRGEFDVSGIPKDNFTSAVNLNTLRPTREMRQRGIELDIYDQPSLFYIGFNMLDPVLGKNKALRQAISLAINREKLNELFYNNRWKIAHSLIHPELNEYDPTIVAEGFSRCDPAAARKLLSEAEKIYGGPIPELTIGMIGGDSFSRQFSQFIQREITSIGLKVKIESTDWPTYTEKINKGQMQIFGGGGVRFSTPDALGALMMFATKYFSPLGNYFFYSNPEYDRLYDQAEVMFPGPERKELYRKMERMVLEDYPAVFTSHRVQYNLRHNWVKNYKPHPFLYGYLKYIDIDREKQKSYKKLTEELKQKKD
jgi:oligopeptide transport system substrate-binding protein